MGNKYSNVLTIALIVGIVIILVGVCVAGVIMMNSEKTNQDSAEAVEQYQKNVKKQNEEGENKQNTQENTQSGDIVEPQLNSGAISPILTPTNTITDPSSNNSEVKKLSEYKGFPMVGTIEIPAINLKSPVLKEATKKSMDVAVGIYDGPGLNQIGNTTIAGHNYRDGRFFANNKKLVEGDKIYITDEINRKMTYSIYKIYTTTPEDSSYLDRNTEGKREISLTTCTDDTQSRLIIWAKEQ